MAIKSERRIGKNFRSVQKSDLPSKELGNKFSTEHVISSINKQINGKRKWDNCPEHEVQKLEMTRAAVHERIARVLDDMGVVESGSVCDAAYAVAKGLGFK